MNKIKLWSLLMLFALIIPSCTNLDEEAFSILPADKYFQDQNSVTATLLRPYEHGHWCAWDGDRWLLQELTADHFMWAQKGKHGADGGAWVMLHGHSWTPEDGRVYGGWIGPYQGIGQCNTCIRDFEGLDFKKFNLTDADKIGYIAEMRTLRAWYYLFVLDFFRNVPIVTVPGELKEQSAPQEVFAFIEKELKESLPGLKKEAQRGRWVQAGAAALLVRLYLNAEKWIGTAKYTECARIAQEIIDKKYGDFELDQDYRGPFRSGVNGYRSKENIFEFPHLKNVYDFGWMYDAMMHYQNRYSFDNDRGGWNGVSLSPSRDLKGGLYTYKLGSPYEKYADTDLRKKPFKTLSASGDYEGFFQKGVQYYFNSSKGCGYDSAKLVVGTEEWKEMPLFFVDQCGRFSEETGLKESPAELAAAYARGYYIAKSGTVLSKGSSIVTGEENTGVRLLKFPWLQMSKDLFMSNSVAEVRIAEIYYSLAECKYRSGDKAGAAKLLDAVRKRNYPAGDWDAVSYEKNLGKLTDQELIDEWGREFLGEHRRRTDLCRWNRFGEEWWAKPADVKDRSVFPIPNRALNANPKLKPNGFE